MVGGQLRGVILNVEGTLIDSNEAHARAWACALAEYGRGLPLATMRRMIGMGADQLLPIVADLAPETTLGAAINARRAAIFDREFLPQLRPFPGARELVARLGRDGWRLVLTDSAAPTTLSRLLAIAGIADQIDATAFPGDAARGKPAPDGVHAALARAGMRPEEALLLGDTPYDVEAAARAGVGMVALRCGGWGDADLAGALALYDDPAALLAHYDASPLARRHVGTFGHRQCGVRAFERTGHGGEPREDTWGLG